MEALRYLPWLSTEGWVITGTAPLVNIPDYPDADTLGREIASLPHSVALDVDAIARQAASPVPPTSCCWAPAPFLGIAPEKLGSGHTRHFFARKGDAIVDTNLAAFRAGYAYAQKQTAQWEGCR